MKEYEGKTVKIIYRDGDKEKVFHGTFKDAEQFIEIQIEDGRKMLLNKNVVLKVIEK